MAYYPPVGFHFKVEFDLPGVSSGGNDTRFQEVTGLTATLNTEELAEGGENRFKHTLPVRTSYEKLVLKRGMLTDSKIISWIKDAIENFDFNPTTIFVKLLNEEHQPLSTWVFINAYPVKWSVSTFNAQDNNMAIETIELAYEYFDVTITPQTNANRN